MREEIDRIACVGDDGESYTVIMYQRYKQFRGFDGNSWVPGMKEAELPNGDPVNYIDDNTFKIVLSDVVLQRLEFKERI